MAQGTIRAAGGVVRRDDQVLVVHRPRYDDWSFPKGKAEGDESDADTARREVTEETGFVCRLGPEVGIARYEDRHGRPKVVRYWEMEPVEDLGFTPGDEVDERRWVPFGEARSLLTYARDREILDGLARPAP